MSTINARGFVVTIVAAIALLGPLPASAQRRDQQVLRQTDPLDFTHAVSLQEVASSGRVVNLVGTRASAIVDDKSRLVIHFDKEILASAIVRGQATGILTQVQDSTAYKRLVVRLHQIDSMRATALSRHGEARRALRTRVVERFAARRQALTTDLQKYATTTGDAVVQQLVGSAQTSTREQLDNLEAQKTTALAAFDDTTALDARALVRTSAAASDSVREQMRAVVLNGLQHSVGFEFSVEARVVPKQGPGYDVPVEGFTTVSVQDDTTHRATDNARVSGSSGGGAITHSQQKRTAIQPYRLTARIFGDDSSPSAQLTPVDELHDGIIELAGLNLAEGDRVLVTVTNHYPRDRAVTWFLNVRDIGVHTQTSASALLVHRLGSLPATGSSDMADTLELRSELEPAPGASFLFSFTSRLPGLNFIRPAIGLNGTFVDFRKDKSIEVGIGPVVSLFDGILQASYGWNLSSNRHTPYWSIGLGFLDLANRIGAAGKGGTDTNASGTASAATATSPPK